MQTLEIITHGNGAVLVDIFNAIARIRNGDFINGAFIVMMTSGYALSLIQNIAVLNTRDIAKWTIAWVLIFGAVYQPTTTVVITDRTVGGQVPVSNVPLGLAAFASITSQMGTNLATLFEDQLNIPNGVTRYTHSGTLMSSKLALAASEIHIVTPHLERSFRNFAFQCIMYDVRIGAKYTMDDLLYHNDIWPLIKDHTSVLRMFEYYGKNGDREVFTCREGAVKLEQELNQEASCNERILAWRFLGKKETNTALDPSQGVGRLNRLIKDYLPASHELLVHMSGQSTEILKKHMVMNAVRESAIKNAQMLDVGAGAQGYAIARAKLQQQNTFQLLGAMAGTGVQYLMGLFEALFYGSFLLIILIAIMPGCQRVLLSYLTSLVWIQSWPTIYTIINFFMTANTVAASNAAASFIGEDGAEGIGWNLFTSPAIIQANLDQAALAGFYSLSVPFIAIAIVKGTGSFVHLAGHLSSISQGAASQAGEELTTGNYGLENVQYLNTSAYNMNANHWDSAPSYRARNANYEMDSGSQMRISGDGTTTLDQSQGMSQLVSNLHLGQSFSQRKSEVLQAVESTYQQAGMSYVDSIGSTLSSAAQAINAGGISTSDGSHFSQSEQAGHMKSIQKFDQLSDRLATQMGWSKDDAMNAMVSGTATFGKSGIIKLPKALAETILGVGVEARVGGSLNHTRSDKETRDKVMDFIQSENATDTIDQAIRATKELHFNQGSDKQDRYSQEFGANLSKMKHNEKQFQVATQKLHSMQNSDEFSEANSANIDHNLNQGFVTWAKEKLDQDGVELGIHGVDRMLKTPDEAQRYAASYLDERIQGLRDKFDTGNNESIGERYQKASHNLSKKPKIEEHDLHNKNKVLSQAKTQGLNIPSDMNLNDTPMSAFDTMNSHNEASMTDEKEHIQKGGNDIAKKVRNKVKLDTKKDKEKA